MISAQPLAKDQLHIWYTLTESLDEPALAAARTLLSDEERSRHDRYRLARDRRDYAVAHALLRTSLSRYRDVQPHMWRFNAGDDARATLSDSVGGSGAGLECNLSHARGMVACAITSGAVVGLDVERTDLAFDCSPIASQCFAHQEIVRLNRCDPQDRSARFVELWTLKEAYIKATGRGFSQALSDFAFQIEGNRIHFMPPAHLPAGNWQFALFAPEPHFRIGVAVAGRDRLEWNITARSSDQGGEATPAAWSA